MGFECRIFISAEQFAMSRSNSPSPRSNVDHSISPSQSLRGCRGGGTEANPLTNGPPGGHRSTLTQGKWGDDGIVHAHAPAEPDELLAC